MERDLLINVGVIVDGNYHSDVRVKNEVEVLKQWKFSIYILCLVHDPSLRGVTKVLEGKITIRYIYLSNRMKSLLKTSMNTFPFYEMLWSKNIKKLVADFDINILHIHDLYMSRAAHMASPQIFKILDLHENYPAAVKLYGWSTKWPLSVLAKPELWEKKELEYLNYANHYIVLSEDFRRLLSRRHDLNIDRFTTYPNLPDLSTLQDFDFSFQLPELFSDKKPTMLYFGRIAGRRGVYECLEAVEMNWAVGKKINFLLIGPMDKADKEKYYQMLNRSKFLKKAVLHIPWIEMNQLMCFKNLIDFSVSPLKKNPQHESGIANKLFQYMFFDKPIIVSNCKPQQELIEKYKCGLVYESGNITELCNCINLLAFDDKTYSGLTGRGKSIIENELNLEKGSEVLKEMYEEIVSREIEEIR